MEQEPTRQGRISARTLVCAVCMVVLVCLAVTAGMLNNVDSALPSGQGHRESFRATVAEVGETTLLVEPEEDSWLRRSGDRITLGRAALPSDVTPQVGTRLEITFDGTVLEIYPLMLGEVYDVTIVE